MTAQKLRIIKDYQKLDKEIQEQVKLVYPDGFSEYLIDFTNNKGELVTALRFETFDKIYMIRMSKSMAITLIRQDDDYDRDGNLKDDVKVEYEDKHSDVEYLSENENYDD